MLLFQKAAKIRDVAACLDQACLSSKIVYSLRMAAHCNESLDQARHVFFRNWTKFAKDMEYETVTGDPMIET